MKFLRHSLLTTTALLWAVCAWAQPPHTFNYANVLQHYAPPSLEQSEIVAVESYDDTISYAINFKGQILFPVRNTNYSTTLNGPTTATNACLVLGISPTGNIFQYKLDITSTSEVRLNDLSVRPGGQVVAVGNFDPAHTVSIPPVGINDTAITFTASNLTGGTDGFILRTDTYLAGLRAYAYRRTTLGAGTSATNINPRHVKVDNDGNIIVVGTVQNGSYDLDFLGTNPTVVNPPARSIFVAKYAPDMTLLMGGLIEGPVDQYSSDIAIDENNNLYISGTMNDAWDVDFSLGSGVEKFGDFDISTSYDGFLAKYNADLSLGWVQLMGAGGTSFANSLAYGNGKIYLGGATFSGVKRQKDGELMPTQLFQISTSNSYGIGYVAAFDTAGAYESMFVMEMTAANIYLIPENLQTLNNRVLVGFRINAGTSSFVKFKNYDNGNFPTLNSIGLSQRAGSTAFSIFIDDQGHGDFGSLRYIDRGTTSSQQVLDIAIDPLTESIHYVGTITGNCDLNLDLGATDELMADDLAQPHGLSPNGTGFFISMSGYPSSTRNVTEASFDAQLYPSPTTDAVTLELNDDTALRHIGVYDLTGRMIQSIEQPQRSRIHRISLSANAAGLYLVRATATDGTARTFKVVKQ